MTEFTAEELEDKTPEQLATEMVEMLQHRRETRRQAEKTSFNLQHREKPICSTQ